MITDFFQMCKDTHRPSNIITLGSKAVLGHSSALRPYKIPRVHQRVVGVFELRFETYVACTLG